MTISMRSLWSIFILFMVSTSCGDQVGKNGQTEDPNREIKPSAVKNQMVGEAPHFENPIVQGYVGSYNAYLEEYAKAVEHKDSEALLRLGPKGQELALKAQEISESMSIEDAQKFKHYLAGKTKLIKELSSKLSE